jgi:hydroxyacylglutathione hydrolase
MWRSLQRLAALPGTTQVFCAHEYTLSNLNFAQHAFPEHAGIRARLTTVKAMRAQGIMTVPSSIDLERQTNPFLLCADAKEFAALRERKDQFRG